MAEERYGRSDEPQGDRYGRREQQGYDDDRTRGGGRDRDRGDQGRYAARDGGDRYSAGGGYSGGSDRYRGDDGRDAARREQGHGRQPQGYTSDDRGFAQRAGDEVRSWFGDEDAERRREADARQDERQGGTRETHHHDRDYHDWRTRQIAAFDRDYAEYREHNQSKFHTEFSSWRTERQSQRDQLNRVEEHMEVVGADGEHVGTVDKVRGDRVILTKNDADAGGRHHSVPSSWIRSVDGKVTLAKTAAEAKQQWRDEERSGAMFGGQGGTGEGDDRQTGGRDGGGPDLNRSFSGTY